jgi:tetratricopeptide (TPR) repeat protein
MLADRLNMLCLRAFDVEALDEAEGSAREAVELRREQPERNPAFLSRAIFLVGYVCWARGDSAEAERWMRECLKGGDPAVIGWRPQAGSFLSNILADRGELEEAEALGREGHAGNRNVEDHWTHWLGRSELALICRLRGKVPEAERLERLAEGKLLGGMVRSLPTAMRIGRVGAGFTKLGLHAKAERFLFEHEATMRWLFPQGWRRWDATSQLGACYAAQSKFAKAEAPVVLSAERLMAITGAPNEAVKRAVERAVAMYEAQEKADPGKGYAGKAAVWRGRLDRQTKPR